MCTAVRRGGFFGRTLDLEISYGEQVAVMPRRFPLELRRAEGMERHLAMAGVACVEQGYPLYYDGVNERGLAMAGLNFPGNACFRGEGVCKARIAPFELIPWVLGQCASVEDARRLLERTTLVDEPFSPRLPPAPLHWMVADRQRSIVVEPLAEGLRVYDDPVDVLTNNPPFPRQLRRCAWFSRLTSAEPEDRAEDREAASRGMGALGLPGDWSSSSRFVRACFVRRSICGDGVGRFLRILEAAAVPEGCVTLRSGQQVKTGYTAAFDLEKGICWYTTDENHRIRGVDMHREQLDGSVLSCYPLCREEELYLEN